MPHADPEIFPNCPKCPRKLAYITSISSEPRGEIDTHVYECPEHGRWLLPPHGRFVTQPLRVH